MKIKLEKHCELNDCIFCFTQFYSDKVEKLCPFCKEIEGTISLETVIDRQISVMGDAKIKYYPQIMKNIWIYIKNLKESNSV